jgi:membrane associated rhomboid family serine protease
MDDRPEIPLSPEELPDLPEAAAPPFPSSPDPVWKPIAVLTAIHAALLGATGSRDPGRLVEVGALAGWPPAGEAYRLVTANFLHADPAHLAVNTAYLVVFGLAAIRLFGLPWSALVYAVGAVASSLASILIVPGDVPSVGSSGCVFALAGATIAGRLRLAAAAPLPRRERWRLLGLAGVLASGVLSANWAAHLGGALAGSVLGVLLPFAGRGSAGAARVAGVAGLAALALPWAWRMASP